MRLIVIAADSLGVAVEQARHVAMGIIRDEHLRGSAIEHYFGFVVHEPTSSRIARIDRVDELHPLGVVRPQRHDQLRLARGRGGHLQFGQRLVLFDDDARRLLERHPMLPRERFDGEIVVARHELLPHGRIGQAARRQLLAIRRDEPAVDRPTILQRCEQPARVDDRIDRKLRQADRGPVAMGEIHMTERERPWDKRDVVGVELPLDPVGPDPVKVVLNRLRVDDAASVEQNPRAQQLNRFRHLRRLGETPNPRQPEGRIGNAVGPGGSFDDRLPWQETEHSGRTSFRQMGTPAAVWPPRDQTQQPLCRFYLEAFPKTDRITG